MRKIEEVAAEIRPYNKDMIGRESGLNGLEQLAIEDAIRSRDAEIANDVAKILHAIEEGDYDMVEPMLRDLERELRGKK